MACDRYDEYIGDGSDRHLDLLKQNVVNDITEVFGIEPSFGIADDELRNRKHRHLNYRPHYIVTTPNNRPSQRFFEGGARLIEVDHLAWLFSGNRHLKWKRNSRGEYHYDAGVIFLHKPLYCRHTMLHEILHATSLFSRIDRYPQFQSQRFLREGITDTLTGYVLNQRYPACCEAWRNDTYDQCGIFGYRPRVKLWSSICRHIGINTISEFYLANEKNIAEPWNTLRTAVQNLGFEDFTFPLDVTTRFNENAFREMAFNAIPGLRDTFNDHSRTIDFSPR